MPPKHKNKTPNRDRRHESGLAPPAKQVKKQKSDIQINGHAGTSAPSINPTSESPFEKHVPTSSRLDESKVYAPGDPAPMAPNHTSFLAALEPSPSSVASADYVAPSTHVASREMPIAGASAKDAALTRRLSTSLVETATTVIAELSMLDVIAILLVLMQLPYSVLGIIQFCFAFLTFGSPPNGWRLSSFSSFIYDLSSSQAGSPSILTMMTVDVVFGWIWAALPKGQDFSLDLAQAVLAVSLGGGSSGRWGHTHSLLCFATVAVYHLLGHNPYNARYHAFGWICSLANALTANTSFGPFEPEDVLDALEVVPDADRNWARKLLEVHIVSQGILRIIRRWFLHSTPARRGDSDPAYIPPGSPSVPMSAAYLDGGRNTSTDGRHPGPSPAPRDSVREKSISAVKKKRRQATFVRSQQPFWAAIANTKVTVLKEFEQSQATRDSFEAGASGLEFLGSSINQCVSCCVWIVGVTHTEVRFKALYLGESGTSDGGETYRGTSATQQLNGRPTPSLIVRVNGAEWSSTAIVSDGTRNDRTLLQGNIYGLTSLTNYMIEFLSPQNGTLLHSVTLLTRPDTTIDQAPVEGPFRPSSPTSTLKKSIAAADANLQDNRNRHRRSKKNRQTALNSLKKDTHTLEGRLNSCGGNDDRQRQRSIQYTQSIKQAEASLEDLALQLKDLGDIPQSQREAATTSKDNWASQKKSYTALRGELEDAKTNSRQALAAAKAETAQLHQKQERLGVRLNKLQTQRAGLVAANEQDQMDQKRRDQTRISELAKVVDEERRLAAQLRSLETQRVNFTENCTHMEQQLQYLEVAPHATVSNGVAVPQTPEGSYSNLAFASRPPPGLGGFPSFQQPIGTPPVHSRRGSLLKQSRVRSSSMLSTASGYTDNEIGGSQPANGVHAGPHPMHSIARDGSIGSSGGSHRPGSDSRPNTTSPAPPKLNPIGAEIGRNSPRNAKN